LAHTSIPILFAPMHLQVGIGGVTEILKWWGGLHTYQVANKDSKGRDRAAGKRSADKAINKQGQGRAVTARAEDLGKEGVPLNGGGDTLTSALGSSLGAMPSSQLQKGSQTGLAMDRYCGFVDE